MLLHPRPRAEGVPEEGQQGVHLSQVPQLLRQVRPRSLHQKSGEVRQVEKYVKPARSPRSSIPFSMQQRDR